VTQRHVHVNILRLNGIPLTKTKKFRAVDALITVEDRAVHGAPARAYGQIEIDEGAHKKTEPVDESWRDLCNTLVVNWEDRVAHPDDPLPAHFVVHANPTRVPKLFQRGMRHNPTKVYRRWRTTRVVHKLSANEMAAEHALRQGALREYALFYPSSVDGTVTKSAPGSGWMEEIPEMIDMTFCAL
jgi:hypothetical protein